MVANSIAAILIGLVCLYLLRRIFGSSVSLPPGPKGLPIIGNLFDLPKAYNWIQWAKYRDLYGPISSLTVLGQHFIIINDQNAAIELLDRKSLIYSDRLLSPFIRMCGFGRQTTFLMYGDDHTLHRKYMQQFVGTKAAVSQLHPMLESEGRSFLLRVLRNPTGLEKHIRL